MIYGTYGKWTIKVENEKKVQFYDNTNLRSYIIEYTVIPQGIIVDSVDIINASIPYGAVKKSHQLIKKYQKLSE